MKHMRKSTHRCGHLPLGAAGISRACVVQILRWESLCNQGFPWPQQPSPFIAMLRDCGPGNGCEAFSVARNGVRGRHVR